MQYWSIAKTCVSSWNLARSDVGRSNLSAADGTGKLADILAPGTAEAGHSVANEPERPKRTGS